jgi:hypothetical protein
VKFSLKLNLSQEILKNISLDQAFRAELCPPLAWYTQRKDKWWKFCKWVGVYANSKF